MESLSLSRSVINNLNDALHSFEKVNRHLQTGNRINAPADDLGDANKVNKLNVEMVTNTKIRQNLQNSLSFLQTQKSQLEIVGSILSRMSELKAFADSPTSDLTAKSAYDEEFRELQEEIRSIGSGKWNGISLFSTQASRVLVGDGLNDPTLYQNNSDNVLNGQNALSRWGIYHGLADKLEAGDKLPTGFGEAPPKNLLAFAISDESNGSYAPNGHSKFHRDMDNWIGLMGEYNIDGKIGLIRAEESAYGKDLLPTGESVPAFAELHEEMPRDDTAAKAAQGFQFLKDTFLAMTDNGNVLPDAFGIFVDNSGSLRYNEVDSPAQDMMNWVQTEYGSQVATSSQNGAGWQNGVFLASDEEWIARSQEAVESMIADPDFQVLAEEGTLDHSASGVKGLLDPVYTIDDFDQSELLKFLGTVSSAIGQNAAEQQRILSEIEELQGRVVGLEKSMESINGLDVAMAMGLFNKTRVQMDINAKLVSSAKQMENILYTDFL